jgi:hypothetical protein
MDYSTIYAKWGELPLDKLAIRFGVGRNAMTERIWVRMIDVGKGVYALDNHPLDSDWRWQDVLTVPLSGRDPVLLHRRWNTRLGFLYGPTEQSGADSERLREEIYQAFSPLGECSFFCEGAGSVFFESTDTTACRALLVEAAAPFNIPDKDIEGSEAEEA